MKILNSLLILIGLLVFSSINFFGQCECDTFSFETFQTTDYVFIGNVAVRTVDNGEVRYQVTVTENFRGMSGRKVVDIFDASSCNRLREPGKAYLFLVTKDPKTKKPYILGCSFSYANANSQKQYIEFFREMAKVTDKSGFILGKVTHRIDREGNSTKPPGVDRVFVEAFNGDHFEATIDDDGYYKFAMLKPGQYRVFLKLPDGLIAYGDIHGFDGERSFRNIEVVRGHGVVEDFSVSVNGVIGGVVRDENRIPVKSLEIRLIGTDDTGTERNVSRGETDSVGGFSFRGIPPGKYLIKVGPSDWYIDPTVKTAAFPITYFPGVLTKSKAETITLGNAEVLRGCDFTVTGLKKRLLAGRVVFADGKPAPNAVISVRISRENDGLKMRSGGYVLTDTNGDGTFSLEVYDETAYLIEAEIWKKTGSVTVDVLFSSECQLLPVRGNVGPLAITLRSGKGNCDDSKFGF